MTFEEAHRLFTYDPETGELRTRVAAGRWPAGRIAGTITEHGYRRVKCGGHFLYAHQIAYLMAHGWLPDEVDHKNRVRSDNRKDNLRASPNRQAQVANTGRRKHNASGRKGVHLCKTSGRWRAQIKVNGRNRHLGYHDCLEAAARAYDAAALEHFGEFANGNNA